MAQDEIVAVRPSAEVLTRQQLPKMRRAIFSSSRPIYRTSLSTLAIRKQRRRLWLAMMPMSRKV